MSWPQVGFDRQDATLAGWDAGWWDIRMDAAPLAAPAVSASLDVPKRLAASVAADSFAKGGFVVPKIMNAQAEADAAVTAVLCVPKILGGATASGSAVCAALTVPKRLAGTARMVAAVSAELRTLVWPEGTERYTRLITSQHKRPRFVALVKTLTAPLVDVQNCLLDMAAAFDVDSAIGTQLDRVGQWVGVSRVLRMGLEGVYFSFDVAGVGYDEGIWRGRFDPDTTLTRLPDDQYRLLIYARIAANHWDGTIPGAYAVWSRLFMGSTVIIQDHQDMSMTVGIAGLPLNAVLRALLIDGYIPLKPQGVRVDYYAIGEQAGPLLGFDTDSPALAGWDVGQWPQELQPRREYAAA